MIKAKRQTQKNMFEFQERTIAMKRNYVLNSSLSYVIIMLILMIHSKVSACSTIKLQKGDNLIYGHNLNQGDICVPGLIFINKRGIFKTGRTWSEIATNEKMNPSSHCWPWPWARQFIQIDGASWPWGCN